MPEGACRIDGIDEGPEGGIAKAGGTLVGW